MPFRIGDRHVDPALNRITQPSGNTVQVEPKIMQVLTTLAERPGEVVTRDDLMARVWSGVFVTDDALHRAVRELRRVFDDTAEAPRIIETIRKRGYRLVATVTPAPPASSVSPPASPVIQSPVSAPRLKSWRIAAVLAVAIGGAGALLAQRGFTRGTTASSATASPLQVRFMPMTSDPGNEVDPALSASGRLAYVARGDDGRAHVFTKSSPEGVAAQVTHGDGTDHAPTWSPDEAQLAFVRMRDADCAIWTAAADGREARALMPCTAADEFHMSWSPDGALLAVTAGGATPQSPSHIETVTVAGAVRRVVTTPPAGQAGDVSPSFSPDGRSIAFVRAIGGSVTDIFVASAEGGSPRRVTSDNGDILGVDWEPDGQHLVYSSDRAGGIGIWRIAVSGGEPTLVAGGGAKLKHPSVARRSGVVAYEDWQYEINLREQNAGADVAADGAAPISPTSDRWNFHPQISPDGRRIVFESTRSGQYELWVSDRAGAGARPVTRSRVYKSPARWAPDSRRLAFTSRRGGQVDLSVLDVDTGAITTVVTESTAAVAPAWSRDGTRIFFGSQRSGDWQIWAVDVATGHTRQETTDGGYAALPSADGQSLLVARLDRRGLWKRPLGGGHETLIAEQIRADQWPNWGLYDRGIFYVTWPDEGDPQLAVIDAGGPAAPRLLARLPDYSWSGIALSRDGSRIVYAHGDRRASNIGALAYSAR